MSNNLFNNVQNAINEAIASFADRVVAEYPSVDLARLEELWNSESEQTVTTKTDKKSTKADKKSTKKTTKTDKVAKTKSASPVASRQTSANSSVNEELTGCPYEFIKGKKKGTFCNVTPKDDKTYCATHKKFEGQEQKKPKVLPDPKRVIRPKTSKSKSTKSLGIVFHKNKILGVLYHPETQLVIRSATDRVVIGKIVDDKVVDLTDDDVATCIDYSFKYQLPEKTAKTPSPLCEPEIVSVRMVNDGKFWEVTVTDSESVTRFGKIGATGVTKTRNFSTHKEALSEMEKTKNKKLKKGYTVEDLEIVGVSAPPVEDEEEKDNDVLSEDEQINEMLDELSESDEFNENSLIPRALGVASTDDDLDDDLDDDDLDDDDLDDEDLISEQSDDE